MKNSIMNTCIQNQAVISSSRFLPISLRRSRFDSLERGCKLFTDASYSLSLSIFLSVGENSYLHFNFIPKIHTRKFIPPLFGKNSYLHFQFFKTVHFAYFFLGKWPCHFSIVRANASPKILLLHVSIKFLQVQHSHSFPVGHGVDTFPQYEISLRSFMQLRLVQIIQIII